MKIIKIIGLAILAMMSVFGVFATNYDLDLTGSYNLTYQNDNVINSSISHTSNINLFEYLFTDESYNSTRFPATIQGKSFYDGTRYNDVQIVNSINSSYGNAVYFDGDGDYLDISNSYDLNQSDGITISHWVKFNEDSINGNGYSVYLNNFEGWYMRCGSSSARFTMSNAGDINTVIAQVPNSCSYYFGDYDWHHVAATVLKNGNISIYIDGSLEDTEPYPYDSFNSNLLLSSYLGGRGTGYSFNGTIDEVRIWNKELTQEEIQEDMISTYPKTTNYLILNQNNELIEGTTHYDLNHLGNGIGDKGMLFDGVNDYINVTTNINLNDYNGFSVNVWSRIPETNSNNGYLFYHGNFEGIYMRCGSSSVRAEIKDALGNNIQVDATNNGNSGCALFNDKEYHMITYTVEKNGYLKIYIDGIFNKQETYPYSTFNNDTLEIFIGARLGSSYFYEGLADELSLFNKSLNQTEITNLYSLNYWNTENLLLKYTFNEKFRDKIHDRLNYICKDCNSSIATYSSLSDNSYYHYFTNGSLETVKPLILDTTTPSLSYTFPINITEYDNFNLSNEINSSDANFDSCLVTFYSVAGAETTNNNCTDIKNLTYNGYYNVKINVTDLAGNSNVVNSAGGSNTGLLLNPFYYVYFNSSLGDAINSFKFGGTTWTDYAAIPIYPTGLGSHIVQFYTLGYWDTDFVLTFNSTSRVNETRIVNVSALNIEIYDSDTASLITQTVDIDLIGDSFAGEFSTSNGTITIYNISAFAEDYQIILDSSGYETTNYYFTNTGYDSIDLNLYMQNNSPTIPIKYIVRDGFGNLMGSSSAYPSCLVKITEYDITTNSYVLTTMDYTNSNGEVIFNLDTTKTIKPITVCSGTTTVFDGGKITSTPVYLTVNDEPLEIFPDLPNFQYDPISYTQVNNETGRFTFVYSDSNGILSEVCLNITQRNYLTETFVDEQCLSTASGSINIDFNTTAGYTYHARTYVTYNGETYFVNDYIKKIFDAPWDFGIWGIIFSLMLIAGLAIGGFFMGKAKGVLVGATAGLWIVWLFGTWSFGVTTSLITWSVLLIVGLIFT